MKTICRTLTVDFPLGKLICVTGVSGSGKSTLVNEILYKTLAAALNGARSRPGQCEVVEGMEWVDKVIGIDQSPIGRTPRSNPATYTGVFGDIRTLFSQHAGCQNARLRPRAVQLQCQGRTLRGLRRRRHPDRLKCTFCRIFMCPVTSARASATTVKRSRSSTRTRPSPTCWT